MNSIFISYRRDDSPDAVARIYEKLTQRLGNREIFYDHKGIHLGQKFPEILHHKVTTADAVLVVIGPKWLELLMERRSAPIDHVHEEVRLALQSGGEVIPVVVGRAKLPTRTELANFPDLLPLLDKNAQLVPPDPDFDAKCEELLAHLERSGFSDVVGNVLVGKYKILRKIAEGGMGEVFEAEQKAPVRRRVAVKLIKAGMDSKEVLARFHAERQALAVMDHPNVCRVLDGGAAPNGRPFFVMEFVKGVPITNYCDEHKLNPKQRLQLFIPVCQAVQHAHQKGIIHRDIKPKNVLVEMVDGKPVPKVIDFGLAKALGQRLTDKSFYTESGKWVGTLEYSSPEQAAGRYDIDALSDVYSLGVLLYELLVGIPPFTRAELEHAGELKMREVIADGVHIKPSTKLSSSENLPSIAASRCLDPGKLTKLVRGELDWIVMKCLEKERDRRYGAANSLAHDIERFLDNQPISAGAPSAVYRLRKFIRRNRGPALASLMVLLALCGGMIGATLGLVRATIEKQRADEAAHNAKNQERDTQKALAKEHEALAALEAWHSQLGRSFCDISDREFHRGFVEESLSWMLQAYEVAPREDSLRESYRHLISGQGRAVDRRLPHSHEVSAVAFSPDGRLALTGGGIVSTEARLWNVASGKQIASLPHFGVDALAFSPDSKLVLTAGGSTEDPVAGESRLWDVATGKPFGEPLRHGGLVRAVAFSPNGKLVLIGGLDTTARLWEVATGKQIAALPHNDDDAWVNAVAFSPDGKLALTGGGSMLGEPAEARLWEVATGKNLAILPHKGIVHAVAFSPDGTLALTGSEDHTARFWEVPIGKSLGKPLLHDGSVSAVAFRPSGRYVLTGSKDKTARLWEIATFREIAKWSHEGEVLAVAFSPDGALALTGGGAIEGEGEAQLWNLRTGERFIVRHVGPVIAVAFSPDGRMVLSGAGQVIGRGEARLWEIPGSKELSTLRHERSVQAVAFSPDGCMILTGGQDKTARLWETSTGKELATLPHKEPVLTVAFSFDGKLAVTGGGDDEQGQGEVWLWDLSAGKPLRDPFRHEKMVNAVAFSPDGRLVLSGSDDQTARLWEVATGKEVLNIPHQGKVLAAAFSRDGQFLFTGISDHTARIWEAATGKPLGQPLLHAGDVNALALRSDGRILLTGSSDKMARLWDVATGKEVAKFSHKREVNAVAFSPDGRLALIGGSSILEVVNGVREEASLLEAATGKEIVEFSRQSQVQAVAFSPDGRLALTGGTSDELMGGEARLWDVFVPLPPDAPVQVRAWVELRTGKAFDERGVLGDLSPDEWMQRSQRLDSSGGDWQPAADARPWHIARAAESEAQYKWFETRFHLDRLLRNEPDNIDFLDRRGTAQAHLGQWLLAIADFGKILDRNPNNVAVKVARADCRAELGEWDQAITELVQALEREPANRHALSHLALGHLGQGDLVAYRRACLSMNERLSASDKPENWNTLSWICCLASNDVEPTQLVRLMDKAVASAPKRYAFLNTRGIVLYRAGRYEDSISQLNEAVEVHGKGGSFEDWVFLALGEFRLGHDQKAREDLKEAIALYDKTMEASKSGGSPAEWFTRVEWQQLRKEAEQLLQEENPE